MAKEKWYVGIKYRSRTAFRTATEPTQQTHGSCYTAVIGPFRTKRAALFLRDNPYCESVFHAEKLAARAVEIKRSLASQYGLQHPG